jgi:HSP20 family protein
MFYPVKRNNHGVYANPFEQIFDQFFTDESRNPAVQTRLAPQFELAETDTEFTIAAELPGLGKENVDIKVDEELLMIRGEKKAEEQKDETRSLFSERRYGSFERTFRLPETVQTEQIAARYENGILIVSLPKLPKAKKPEPRQINIK